MGRSRRYRTAASRRRSKAKLNRSPDEVAQPHAALVVPVADFDSRTEALRDDPRPQGGEKLTAQERYRFRRGNEGIVYGVEDAALMTLLTENADPQPAAEAIVAAAQKGGSKDNITCLVLNVE